MNVHGPRNARVDHRVFCFIMVCCQSVCMCVLLKQFIVLWMLVCIFITLKGPCAALPGVLVWSKIVNWKLHTLRILYCDLSWFKMALLLLCNMFSWLASPFTVNPFSWCWFSWLKNLKWEVLLTWSFQKTAWKSQMFQPRLYVSSDCGNKEWHSFCW